MKIALCPEGPLDVPATLARYRLWGEDPVNRLVGDTFLRLRRFEGRLWPYAVRWTGPVEAVRLEVDIPGARGGRVEEAVALDVHRVLGLDFDLAGFYRMAKPDRALGPLSEALCGLRPTLTPGGLEMLVGSITAQQVNLAFAFALRARLVRRYGQPVAITGETIYAFPEAETLARADLGELRAMQFSVRKAEYIRDVARAVARGALDLDGLAETPSGEVIDLLTSHRGLGRWTAEWFLARCLGRGDICPAGDLAVRKAFAQYYGRGRALSERAIRRRAGRWGPHQTVAVHYLLAGLRLVRSRVGGGT